MSDTTIDYTKLTKEALFDIIEAGCIPCLMEMETQLLAYGWSKDGILMNKLRRKLQELKGLSIEPELVAKGKDLPPITGNVNLGRPTIFVNGIPLDRENMNRIINKEN